MGAVAAVMLLVGGDEALTGLQNLTIIAALPFALVMVGLAVSLAKDVRSDPLAAAHGTPPRRSSRPWSTASPAR